MIPPSDEPGPASGLDQKTPCAVATSQLLTGVVVSEGIAIGTALVISERLKVPRYEIPEPEIKQELSRFDRTLVASREQLQVLKQKHWESSQTVRILESQMLMLVDPLFMGDVIQRIRGERRNAEAVVADVTEEFCRSFEALEDPYMRERAADVRDIGHRIIRNLLGREYPSLESAGLGTVLICHQLSPSEVAHVSTRRISGIAAEVGGTTSHAAILARGLGIPALVGVTGACSSVASGDHVILDCVNGRIRVNPSHEEVVEYSDLKRRLIITKERLLAAQNVDSATQDGVSLSFRSNISVPAEVESIRPFGAQGVGLLRTEYLYMSSGGPPSEEDQYEAYRRVVEASPCGYTIIRTLDIGGDKNIPYLGIPDEKNPFLGWRSIRFCLDNPSVFKTQLRAILRAAAHGSVKVIYPMISSVEEVRQANQLVAEVRWELDHKGISYGKDVPIGVMIEVPSAALIAERLAEETAFFSIGTNDLIQYTMAVDRTNERLWSSFETLPLSVLRLIQMVMRAAEARQIPVSCCGEIGATPAGFLLLLGLGIRDFSMNVFAIPQLKLIASRISLTKARELVTQVMSLSTTEESRMLLENYLRPILESIEE